MSETPTAADLDLVMGVNRSRSHTKLAKNNHSADLMGNITPPKRRNLLSKNKSTNVVKKKLKVPIEIERARNALLDLDKRWKNAGKMDHINNKEIKDDDGDDDDDDRQEQTNVQIKSHQKRKRKLNSSPVESDCVQSPTTEQSDLYLSGNDVSTKSTKAQEEMEMSDDRNGSSHDLEAPFQPPLPLEPPPVGVSVVDMTPTVAPLVNFRFKEPARLSEENTHHSTKDKTNEEVESSQENKDEDEIQRIMAAAAAAAANWNSSPVVRMSSVLGAKETNYSFSVPDSEPAIKALEESIAKKKEQLEKAKRRVALEKAKERLRIAQLKREQLAARLKSGARPKKGSALEIETGKNDQNAEHTVDSTSDQPEKLETEKGDTVTQRRSAQESTNHQRPPGGVREDNETPCTEILTAPMINDKRRLDLEIRVQVLKKNLEQKIREKERLAQIGENPETEVRTSEPISNTDNERPPQISNDLTSDSPGPGAASSQNHEDSVFSFQSDDAGLQPNNPVNDSQKQFLPKSDETSIAPDIEDLRRRQRELEEGIIKSKSNKRKLEHDIEIASLKALVDKQRTLMTQQGGKLSECMGLLKKCSDNIQSETGCLEAAEKRLELLIKRKKTIGGMFLKATSKLVNGRKHREKLLTRQRKNLSASVADESS